MSGSESVSPGSGEHLQRNAPYPQDSGPIFAALPSPGRPHPGNVDSSCLLLLLGPGPGLEVLKDRGSGLSQSLLRCLAKGPGPERRLAPCLVSQVSLLTSFCDKLRAAILGTRGTALGGAGLGEGFLGKLGGRRKSSPEPAPRGHTRPGVGGGCAGRGGIDPPGWGWGQ